MKLKTKEQLSVIEYEKSLTKKELLKYRIAAICLGSLTFGILAGSITAFVWFAIFVIKHFN